MKLAWCTVAACALAAGCALVVSLDDLGGGSSDASNEGGNPEASCGDTTSSSSNCGRCGHDCRSGACTSGVCQPALLAAAAQSSIPSFIDVDGANVYWVEGTTIKRASTAPSDAGVTPLTTVPSPQYLSAKTDIRLVGQLVAGGTFEIFGASETQPGDASVLVNSLSASDVRAYGRDTAQDYVYIHNGPCGGNGAGCIQVIEAGKPVMLAPNLAPDGMLVVDGRIFFYSGSSIQSIAPGEDAGVRLATTDAGGFTSIAADPNGVYVTNGPAKSIMRAPRVATDGGPPETLVGQQDTPSGAVARAGLLVWITNDGLIGCDPTNCDATKRTYAAAPNYRPAYVTLDSDAIYFTDAMHGAIWVVVR